MSEEDKKYNVTSFNQLGGITAGQVNFSSPPRQMDEGNAQTFREFLTPGAKVNIKCPMGDNEAFSFASQMKQWLDSNGYETGNIVHCVYNNPVLGQHLNKRDDGEFDLVVGTKK